MRQSIVRRAGIGDWAALRDVRLLALAGEPSAFGSSWARESAFDEERWRQRAHRGIWFLAWPDHAAATADQVPDGMVGGVLRPGTGGCELIGMWVDPGARGSLVAGQLVAVAAGWARRSGAGRLDLWVCEANRRARAFYLRQGFLETGETQELPERNGSVEIGMTLPLI